MNIQKANLRRKIMRDLKSLSPAEIKTGSLSIRRRLGSWLRQLMEARSNRKVLRVAVFAARSFEVNLLPMVRLMRDIEWYFPECAPGRKMIFRRVTAPSIELVEGFMGIQEPAGNLPAVDAAELDVVITPGAGFSLDGKRLGFGGGFYDTLFSSGLKAIKIGVCLPCQVYDDIPGEDHDLPVDYVVVAGRQSSLGSNDKIYE